ncbi:MAG: histidine--tRNA ligase [Gemmatimonadaceae bacterium]|nr:histidine--tRNA ligase [Gemmatimonadaceae bacterium]
MAQGALPGFRDFYPEQFAERAYIMSVWRRVLRRYAFMEYDGPPLEHLDLYRKKSGDELVGQLYSFTDKGDREVALRPEMTPTLARMVAARANSLRKPVRWFSIPQLFRYERQQKGRLREHFQLNADIVGEPGVTADAELLALALDVMREFGLSSGDVNARVSDRRLLQSLLAHAGVADESLASVYAVIDKRGREPADVSRKKLIKATGGERIADTVEEILSCRDVESLTARYSAVSAAAGHIQRMRDYLDHLGSLGFAGWVRLDLSVVRGLAYYTGIVFELFDTAGEYRAICGGGRYDTLLQTLGGVDLPALGFGMGDVVLGELLHGRGLMPTIEQRTDYWVAGEDESMIGDVMRVAAELRRRDRSAEYALKPQQLSRQLKAASAAGADNAVLLKREAFARGEITVKDMKAGTEQSLSLDDFFNSLKQDRWPTTRS